MGTEIFQIDAPWAEKVTKPRVQFLLTPTVSCSDKDTHVNTPPAGVGAAHGDLREDVAGPHRARARHPGRGGPAGQRRRGQDHPGVAGRQSRDTD